MFRSPWFRATGLTVILFLFSLPLTAQIAFGGHRKPAGEDAGQGLSPDALAIQDRLNGQIRLTRITADNSDIVTAGDIVQLNRDGLMMCSIAAGFAYSNTYDGGVLTANQRGTGGAVASAVVASAAKSYLLSRFGLGSGLAGGAADAASAAQAAQARNTCPSRKFVTGEKFWVTGISAEADGILVNDYSDPNPDPNGNDVRYYGLIKFDFPPDPNAVSVSASRKKGAAGARQRIAPPADDFLRTVAEVISVVSSDDQAAQPADAPEAAPAPVAPPPAPMAEIPPPPPPPEAPPTIEPGQNKDQVVAAFGQPLRVAKFGAKEIFFYKDTKVTFIAGKVTNVE